MKNSNDAFKRAQVRTPHFGNLFGQHSTAESRTPTRLTLQPRLKSYENPSNHNILEHINSHPNFVVTEFIMNSKSRNNDMNMITHTEKMICCFCCCIRSIFTDQWLNQRASALVRLVACAPPWFRILLVVHVTAIA